MGKFSVNDVVAWHGMVGVVLYEEVPSRYRIRFPKWNGDYQASVYESELVLFSNEKDPEIEHVIGKNE